MAIVTDNGITLKTLEEIIIDNTAEWTEKTGEVDVAPSSASGEQIAITSEMEARSQQDAADAYLQTTVENATGVYLDKIGELKNIYRKTDVKTIVYVKITAPEDTVIEQGRSFTCSENDEIFLSQYQVTIPTGETIAYVSVESQNIGVSCPIGTIELTTPVAGITVTNDRAGVVGFEEESDTVYRVRIQNFTSTFSINLKDGLYYALDALDGVTNINILDNQTLSPIFDVPGKNFAVVILGGDPAEIAQTIYTWSGVGNPSFGTESQNTLSASGQTYIVQYSRPDEILVEVDIVITTDSSFDANTGQATVKQNAIDYINGLNIGDDALIQRVAAVCMITGVTNVVIELDAASVSILADYNEILFTNAASVTIS